jgi:hypothetical protein
VQELIQKPTVLILGAGASSPYGFPTGLGLSQSIIGNLRPLLPHETRGKNDWVPFLREHFGIPADEVHSFVQEPNFSRLSVDAFLEHRPEYINIGKLSIALSLIAHEHEKKLFNTQRNWYDYLRLKLNAPFSEFGDNKLSIITFNYDRSIEQYLFMVLKHTYGETTEQCAEQINKILMIHVHGKIGALPWQGPKSRSYEPMQDPELVEIAKEEIIVISESEDSSGEFKQAFKVLERAEPGKIFFLGFGYNDISLKRLKISRILSNDDKTPIAQGTAFHVPDSDRHYIQTNWPITFSNPERDVLDFLQNVAHLE